MEKETKQESGPYSQPAKIPSATKICIFILAIVLLFYISWHFHDKVSTTQKSPGTVTSEGLDSLYINKWGASIIPINGCQYALFRDYAGVGAVAMVHAGNCNNPEHKIIK